MTLGKYRAVVANAVPFGVDVLQCATIADCGKGNGTSTCGLPTSVADSDDHVAGICNHHECFDLAVDARCQGSSTSACCGEVAGSG